MGISIYGELSCFDTICILFLLFFYKIKIKQLKDAIVYTVVFFVFIVGIFIGIITAQFNISLFTFYLFLSVLNVFFYAKILIDECLCHPDYFNEVVHNLKIILVFSFVFLVLQFLIGTELSLSNFQNPNITSSEGIRYPSFLSDPQVYSQYLGCLAFLCLIDYSTIQTSTLNKYAMSILCLVGILIAGGRAGLLGFLIGFFFLLLFSKPRIRLTYLFVSIVLYFIVSIFLNDTMMFKRGTDMNDAYLFRYSVWMDAISIFKKFPFLGIGLGNYTEYVSIHYPNQVWMRDNEFITFDHPESGYLKILTETGIIGFLCFILFFLVPIVSGIRRFIITKDITLILLIAAILCWMVGFYSTYSIGDTRLKILVTSMVSLLIFRLNYNVNIDNEIKKDKLLHA